MANDRCRYGDVRDGVTQYYEITCLIWWEQTQSDAITGNAHGVNVYIDMCHISGRWMLHIWTTVTHIWPVIYLHVTGRPFSDAHGLNLIMIATSLLGFMTPWINGVSTWSLICHLNGRLLLHTTEHSCARDACNHQIDSQERIKRNGYPCDLWALVPDCPCGLSFTYRQL